MSGCYDVIADITGTQATRDVIKLPGTYWVFPLGTPVDTQHHPSTSPQSLVIQ